DQSYNPAKKAATSTTAHTYATAAFDNLQNAAAFIAAYIHSYAKAAFNNLKRAAAATTEAVHSNASKNFKKAAAATVKLTLFQWQTFRAWQTTHREHKAKFANELIEKSEATLNSPLVEIEAALRPQLIETRIGVGFVFSVVAISTLVVAVGFFVIFQ